MDSRHSPRVSVKPQCKARFQLGGQTYDDITVSNLGQDGCCLSGSTQSLSRLRDTDLLEGWQLVHPALPQTQIKAKVVWVGREDQGKESMTVTGIQFQDAPASYLKDVGKYVKTMASH